MGFILSKVTFVKYKPSIIILGLDSAGKTTILYRLKLNENVTKRPTIGFHIEDITLKNVTLTLWDVGGQEKIRHLWRYYYQCSEGLLFVIDSSDVNRVEEARQELFSVLNDKSMYRRVPAVILANKQDLPNALKSWELVDKLSLRELKANPWHIQEICALTGDGLVEGVSKLLDMVKTFQKIPK